MPSRALPDPLAPGLADPLARSAAAQGLVARLAMALAEAQAGDRSPQRREFLALAGILLERLAQAWEHRPGDAFMRLRDLGLGVVRAGYGGYCRLAHAEGLGSAERARRSWIARLFSEAVCALLGVVPGVIWVRDSSALDSRGGCFIPAETVGSYQDLRMADLAGLVPNGQRNPVSAQAANLIAYLSDDPLGRPDATDVDTVLGLLARELVLP